MTQCTKGKLKPSFLNSSGHGLEGMTLTQGCCCAPKEASSQPRAHSAAAVENSFWTHTGAGICFRRQFSHMFFSPHALALPLDVVLVVDAKATALETESFCTCTAVPGYCLASAQS